MKNKILIGALSMVLLGSAAVASAQTTPSQPNMSCPSLRSNLYVGMRDVSGTQIVQLQNFLNARYGNQPVTGYFGSITRANVARFQKEIGVSAVGGVGPLTRAAIIKLCGGVTSNIFEASPASGQAPLDVAFKINQIPAGADMASLYVDFGDGTTANAQTIYCIKAPCIPAMTAQHTYQNNGSYIAKLMQNNNYCAPGMFCAAVYREPTQLASVTVNVSSAGAQTYNFSADPTTGTAPLGVTFTMGTSITNADGSYIVDFGDGANAIMTKGSCVGIAAIQGGQGGIRCSFTASHTYQSKGTYTATLSPYIACMYANPRCMIATQMLGSATIVVY